MKHSSPLEAHVVRQYDTWKERGDLNFYKEFKDKYDEPHIRFASNVQISAGELAELEIHVGNTTTVYFEKTRFKPVKLAIVAIPHLNKNKYCQGDFELYAEDIYLHPNGMWYSDGPLHSWDNDKKVPVIIPFDYVSLDLLDIPKANKLLKRNSVVLEEIRRRLSELNDMEKKLSGNIEPA